MSEEEKKEKYEEILAAQEELELVNAQVEELENLLRKAQADYDAFAGPSSFPKLIANTRKNGVLLPFTVNVYKGSPLVLTVWKQDEVFEVKSDVKSASDQSTKNTDAKSPPPKNKLSVTFDEVSVMTAGTAKKHSTIGEEASVIENNGKSIELSSSKSNLVSRILIYSHELSFIF